ncbi:nucleotidyltransferase [Chryseobacterium nematophagum]|uniref:Nucleotidyltransferase n=1 Tax=Chryseobacterium nematophagum TaxID=2305228 RepID=A0A3M7TL22_9FLAO|nr:nucleotidyltransferase [Chryseobacterium nematophagum]RNA64008.1 nucleotidyltransferase [Chryseobacterium nematophagum]
MNISLTFQEFLSNIKINEEKASTISNRYGRITKALNKYFRTTESTIANSLQVGSYGRYSGIKGISDLDMLYIIPSSKWDNYNKKGGQFDLLQDTKKAIENTYAASDIKVDRCVVTVKFSDGTHIDVQPVFEIEDQDYRYPDTYGDGSWKTTKPRKEMDAMVEAEPNKNKNLRRLCKMARSWKNKHGVFMGGLLIDTLAYNFLNSTNYFDSKSYYYFDEMSRDFFKYLYDQPKDQKEYGALGSKQRVRVKKSFRRKSKKAYDLACDAIEATSEQTKHNKWRDIYGNDFPKYKNEENEAKALNLNYQNTEEFIENLYPVVIQYGLEIDCEIKQNGYRDGMLREFLAKRFHLLPGKSLTFFISEINIPYPYTVKWKVTNRGNEAIKKNCIRGQIIDDGGHQQRIESSSFRGGHFVECYIIKDNIVVAKDSIDVPISG